MPTKMIYKTFDKNSTMKSERVAQRYSYDRFGELLYVLHTNNRKYLHDSLAEHGLSLVQSICIITIHQKSDITQQELSDLLYLTKSGTAKAINKLEEDGFIVKEKSENDHRKFVLKLTDKGHDIIPTLIAINNDWEEKIGLNELDDEFHDTLKMLTYRSIELNFENE